MIHPESVILLLVADATQRAAARAALAPAYECIEAASVCAARDAATAHPVDAIVADLDLIEGVACEWLNEQLTAPDAPSVVVVIPRERRDEEPHAWLAAGAVGCVTKPLEREVLRLQVLAAVTARRRRMQSERSLRAAQSRLFALPRAMCRQLVDATRMRDGETGAHVLRIRDYSRTLARGLGFDATNADALGEAALLHDVGKIGVPDAILQKRGPLTAQERTVIESHAVLGERLLGDLPELTTARAVARWHHERWDGAGYPDRLRGSECPIEARIVALVDVFDALSHERVYKQAWPLDRVLVFIHEQRGHAFEPRIVDAFMSMLPEMLAIQRARRDPLPAAAERY